jgi:hypothetical protein
MFRVPGLMEGSVRMRKVLSVLVVLLSLSVVACSGPATGDQAPFNAHYSVFELMEGPVAHAAEVYWGSVSTIVDVNGITENFPRTDEELEAVWAAGITLAEAGNLLMMSPRAPDEDAWMMWSSAMVEAGVAATDAAEAKNPDRVLEEGEKVYNVCTGCHMQYIPDEGAGGVPTV